MVLTLKSMRIFLAKIKKVANLSEPVIQGSELFKNPLVAIYNAFKDGSDHFPNKPCGKSIS